MELRHLLPLPQPSPAVMPRVAPHSHRCPHRPGAAEASKRLFPGEKRIQREIKHSRNPCSIPRTTRLALDVLPAGRRQLRQCSQHRRASGQLLRMSPGQAAGSWQKENDGDEGNQSQCRNVAGPYEQGDGFTLAWAPPRAGAAGAPLGLPVPRHSFGRGRTRHEARAELKQRENHSPAHQNV